VTEVKDTSQVVSDTGPFVIIPEWVLVSKISHGAVRLYALLGRYADYETGEAFPSRKLLATRLDVSVATVDRMVKELVDIGALEVFKRCDNGIWLSNLYRIRRVPGSPTSDEGSPTSEDRGSPMREGRGSPTSDELTRTTTNENQLNEKKTRQPEVQQVFDLWLAVTGKDRQRTKLDSKREARIVWALKAYPLDDVLDAVQGWQKSQFHSGQNSDGKVWNDLTLLLRNAEKLEFFRDCQRRPTPAGARVSDTWRRLAGMIGDKS